jgi:hypothetical protein
MQRVHHILKTLVKASPTFPTYESIGDAKQIEKRIIGPFERDLEAAAQATGGKFYWNYAGVNTEDPPATYADFIDAKIFITWNEYPDTATIKRAGSITRKWPVKENSREKDRLNDRLSAILCLRTSKKCKIGG